MSRATRSQGASGQRHRPAPLWHRRAHQRDESIGGLPTGNFQDGYFPTADKVGGETLAATLLQRPKGCFSCIISCGRVTKVTNPKYQGEGEGPEYETAWGFGRDCMIDDLDAVTKANYYCNEMGIDTISMAGTIACAMELFRRE